MKHGFHSNAVIKNLWKSQKSRSAYCIYACMRTLDCDGQRGSVLALPTTLQPPRINEARMECNVSVYTNNPERGFKRCSLLRYLLPENQ
jgi:hypothetical protein